MAIKNKTEEERYKKIKQKKNISKEECLDREAVAETKNKYHNGKIVAMAGAKVK